MHDTAFDVMALLYNNITHIWLFITLSSDITLLVVSALQIITLFMDGLGFCLCIQQACMSDSFAARASEAHHYCRICAFCVLGDEVDDVPVSSSHLGLKCLAD